MMEDEEDFELPPWKRKKATKAIASIPLCAKAQSESFPCKQQSAAMHKPAKEVRTLPSSLVPHYCSSKCGSADLVDSPARAQRKISNHERQAESRGLSDDDFQSSPQAAKKLCLRLGDHSAKSDVVKQPARSQSAISHPKKGFCLGGKVEVCDQIAKNLKPHQQEGIEFMWKTCVVQNSGCILAHSMGLGKTLQVVSLVHTFARERTSQSQTARSIVLAPCTLITNWRDEFEKWIPATENFRTQILSNKTKPGDRLIILRKWFKAKRASCLILSYETFCILGDSKEDAEELRTILFTGPDLAIFDEGHRLKNDKSRAGKALRNLATRRRVLLTGTPLQNNLEEYFCMCELVRPRFLGTKQDFKENFAEPIKLGMMADATLGQVKFAKKRTFVLHKKLGIFVHRRDESILKALLPPKEELVLYCRLSKIQLDLYQRLLDHHNAICEHAIEAAAAKQAGGEESVDCSCNHLLCAASYIQRLNAHPDILHELYISKKQTPASVVPSGRSKKPGCAEFETESEGEIPAIERSEPSELQVNMEGDDAEVALEDHLAPPAEERTNLGLEWCDEAFSSRDYSLGSLENSGKFMVLLEILKQCRTHGEKVLVFSQSVKTLNRLQEFLNNFNKSTVDKILSLRLDGSTPQKDRQTLVNRFNAPGGKATAFLISTKAGGVGLNLIAASRVVIVDSSWNPASDSQAAVRAFRMGQTKPVFVYRLVGEGTMEQFIYDRQVSKVQLSMQVVDTTNVTRIYSSRDLAALFRLESTDVSSLETVSYTSSARADRVIREDSILSDVLKNNAKWIFKISRHEDAVEENNEEDLSKEEEEAALLEWEAREKENRSSAPALPSNAGELLPGPVNAITHHTNRLGHAGTLVPPTEVLPFLQILEHKKRV